MNKQMKQRKNDTSKIRTLNCRIDWDSKSVTKAANGNLTIEGMANTSDLDRVGDIVLPSAFEKNLPQYLDNPVLLSQHNWDDVIGRVVEANIVEDTEATSGGLWIKAEISNAPDTESVRTKIREGSLKTFSIGYNEVDATYDRVKDCYIVKEVELLEISVVTIPANPNARFSALEEVVDTDKKSNDWSEEKLAVLADSLNQLDKSELLDANFLKELFTIILGETE